MAASSEDDIPTQLAALLGTATAQIRKTTEIPPRVSVIDVAVAITGRSADYSSQAVRNVCDQYPEVREKITDCKFKGRRQRKTPVTDVKGIIELIFLLPGRHATRVRRQAASLMTRYLGGDIALVHEVCALRGLQEHHAAHSPDDPRRVFGEAVEPQAPAQEASRQVALACTQAINNAVPAIMEKLTSLIDQRLLQDRARVNLNVRAPKRGTANQPPIARDISGAGRPLPLAKFLDERATADASWIGVRRSLTPFFGMQMQVLKKWKLREDGAEALYVEQVSLFLIHSPSHGRVGRVAACI